MLFFLISLGTSLVLLSCSPVHAQPPRQRVSIVVIDEAEAGVLPPHLNQVRGKILSEFYAHIRSVVADLVRFEVVEEPDMEEDYLLSVTVRKFIKSFRNKHLLGRPPTEIEMTIPPEARFLNQDESPQEVVAEPVIIVGLECKVTDAVTGKIVWSGFQDSTCLVPYDVQQYLFVQYPQLNDPELMSTYMVDIAHAPALMALQNVSRVFLSTHAEDVETTRRFFQDICATLQDEVDRRLPVVGDVIEVVTGDTLRVQLNIGSTYGVEEGQRMMIVRPVVSGGRKTRKIGEIQVERVRPLSAVAFLLKIDKNLRKEGGSVEVGDRVISKGGRRKR
jgi:hypothetical protein